MNISKMCCAIITLFSLVSTVLAKIEEDLDHILLLSKLEQQMMMTKEPYEFDDYAAFALVVSGVPDDKIADQKKKLDQLLDKVATELELRQVPENTMARSDHILQLLHTLIFEKYDPAQTRIDGILDKRSFNCVSSAVFYAVVCRKFDISITGVITADHSFAHLKLSDTTKIDIETTINYGFDPSSKTGILDQFGQLTGFAYVDPKNYRQRKEISDREMIALVLSNRYDALTKQGNQKEATAVLCRAYRLAGNLPFTTNTWENAINNYIVWLEKEQRSQDALYALARLGEAFPEIKKVRDLQYGIYVNWTQELIKDSNYALAIATAEEGLNYFPDNQFLRQNLKAGYLEQYYRLSRNGDFNPAFSLIKRMTDHFPKEKDFETLAINLVTNQAKTLPTDTAEKLFLEAISKYPSNQKLRELFAYRLVKQAEHLELQNKLQEAVDLLDHAQQIEAISSFQSMIVPKEVSILNNWALQLLQNKDYSQARSAIERGFELEPHSKPLNNNWDVVMLQWGQLAYNKGQFKKSIQILTDGRQRSKRDKKTFTQLIEMYYNETAFQLLDAGKVEESIARFEEGLKHVPKSETLKYNLDIAKSERESSD